MEKTKGKKINLYISCSTKSDVLSNQKKTINNLRDELNEEYAKNGFVVKINTVGYDDPESRENIYRIFIHHTADIVVFLVAAKSDKKEMDRLERELERVVKRHNKESRPEILIYLPKDAKGSLSGKAEKMIKENQINIKKIEDADSLKVSVEQNIRAYIDSYDMLKKVKRWAILRSWALFPGTPVLLILTIIIICWLYNYWSQKRLLIAGGGSAEHFIEYYAKSHTGKNDVTKGMFRIYSPIPSRNAYRLLTEETQMDIVDENYENRSFYTIILSAGEANIYDFLRCGPTKDTNIKKNNIKKFREVGVVIGIHMGMDSLVVYSKIQDSLSKMPRRILPDALNDSIISLGKDILYTTNVGSGTLGAYNESFKSKHKDTIVPLEDHVFYSSNSIERDSNNNKWIALGSQYYSPKHKVTDGVDTTFVDSVKPKQVYIYFMKYKEKNIDKFVIPKETKKFLEDIGIPDKTIEEIENSRVDDTTTILFDHFCADTTCKAPNHIHQKK